MTFQAFRFIIMKVKIMEKLFEHELISEYSFIKTENIPFDEKARDYCKANLCSMYAKTWSCPPSVGSTDDCRKQINQFENAFIFSHKGIIEDLSDNEAVCKLRDETMNILYTLSDRMKEKKIKHLALGCSACTLCKNCTYPDSPCRFPEKMTHPVESYAIDVKKICNITEMTYMQDKTVTFFCIIFY